MRIGKVERYPIYVLECAGGVPGLSDGDVNKVNSAAELFETAQEILEDAYKSQKKIDDIQEKQRVLDDYRGDLAELERDLAEMKKES